MRHRIRPGSLAFLLLLLPLLAVASEPFSAMVVAISDGDTVKVLTADKQQIKIRLAEIDTPEKGQPWGNRARQALSALVFKQTVRVEPLTTDRYGRTVARLFVGETDVNREMVRTGDAWVYRKYLRDDSLLQVEAEARSAQRGLWSLPQAQRVPPWEWRRMQRENR